MTDADEKVPEFSTSDRELIPDPKALEQDNAGTAVDPLRKASVIELPQGDDRRGEQLWPVAIVLYLPPAFRLAGSRAILKSLLHPKNFREIMQGIVACIVRQQKEPLPPTLLGEVAQRISDQFAPGLIRH